MDLKEDGTFRLNMEYFDYCTGLAMTNRRFDQLFGAPRVNLKLINAAANGHGSIVQEVTEEVMSRLSRTLHRETGAEYLCMAGGVALNCVGNGRILREGPFKESGFSRQRETQAAR